MSITFVGMEDPGGQLFAYSYAINAYTNYISHCIVGYNSFKYDDDIVAYRRKNISKAQKRNIQHALKISKTLIIDGGQKTIDWLYSNFKYTISANQNVFYFYGDVNVIKNPEVIKFPAITTQNIIRQCSEKHIVFIPSIINLGNPRYRNIINKDKRVVLSHSTKDRRNKNTNAFMRVATMVEMDFNVKSFLVEKLPFDKAIEFKKVSNIGIDHIHPEFCYYGLSSLENSALGLVNCVYLTDSDLDVLKDFLGCSFIPWKIVRRDGDLYVTIKEYVNNIDKLYQDRLITYNWFHTYWNNNIIINKILKRIGL